MAYIFNGLKYDDSDSDEQEEQDDVIDFSILSDKFLFTLKR